MKPNLPPSVASMISDWSLFDILCLHFIIKDYMINGAAVMSAFILAKDPQEAQQRLMHMRANSRRNRSSSHFPHVLIPEGMHDHLFKRGVIQDCFNKMIGFEPKCEDQKQLALPPNIPAEKVTQKRSLSFNRISENDLQIEDQFHKKESRSYNNLLELSNETSLAKPKKRWQEANIDFLDKSISNLESDQS